jgi:putative DNA-invertase from lambdoid prophage Rac
MKGANISVHLLDLGGDVTDNGVAKAFFTMASAFAELERDRTRERIVEAKADQRRRGRYLGGIAPFGWRVGEAGELEPIPEQQAAIRKMRRLRERGASLRAIAAEMKAGGILISHVGVQAALR